MEVVVACSLPEEAERVAREAAERLGLRFYRFGECRLGEILSSIDAPAENILVVAAYTPADAERLRRVYGLFKLVSLEWCPVDALPETIEAVSCRPLPARCLVDAGLGWLQA